MYRFSLVLLALVACGSDASRTWVCSGASATTEFVTEVGCEADFLAIASRPLDATIPGARSVKTVIDRFDEDALYFQNSELYETHYQFASKHLSGNGKPIVPMLASFNATEYYSPSRRFVLGALT